MVDHSKDRRREQDARFNDLQKQNDQLGSSLTPHKEKVRQTVNGKDAMEIIKRNQKEQQRIIADKMSDNRRRGRTLNDGENY